MPVAAALELKGLPLPSTCTSTNPIAHRRGTAVSSTAARKSLGAVPVGTDLSRLALKMCVALIEYGWPELDVLHENVRAFLLGSTKHGTPVQNSYVQYEKLYRVLPPLSHSIYVGTRWWKGAYGVVHVFGFLQLYVQLNAEYDGPPFSYLAVLQPPSWEETFSSVPALRLSETPQRLTAENERAGRAARLDYLQMQMFAYLGDTALLA